MKKIWCVAGLLSASALASEGMWMPHQLPQMDKTLKDAGIEIAPAALADLTKHPMNAVISLGGCTASFVSPKGLVVTNHHCAYGSISYNSSADKNLIKDGFLAKTLTDELPAAPGSRVFVTVAMDDVTAKVNDGLAQLSGKARFDAIEEKEKALVAACEQEAGYRCSVYSYYGGLEHWLLKQMEIKDVRLVYAPAEAVGVYGGDIDNWMWPRHTGDFAFYRAYVGKDGKPAEFSKDNVPYEPKHFLKVNGQGVAKGDFVMVAGYPGSTNRYRTAVETAHAIDWYYPTSQKRLADLNDVIGKACEGDEDACIKYASYRQGLKNYAKNFQGMLDGFKRSDLVERKQKLEAELAAWVKADADRQAQWGQSLDALAKLIEEDQRQDQRDMLRRGVSNGALFGAARTLYKWSLEQQKPDAEREAGYQARDKARKVNAMKRIERRFHPKVDKALWLHGLESYAKLDKADRIQAIDQALKVVDGKGASAEVLDGLYANTQLTDTQVRLAWLDKKPEDFKKSSDPFIQLAVASHEAFEAIKSDAEERYGRFMTLRPKFMEALIAFKQEKGELVYPDANSSLRVTYGHVRGYTPPKGTITQAQDGALYRKDGQSEYLPFTTLQGIVAKHTGETPFDAPKAQRDLINDRDFGAYYMQSIDSVPVNYLSDVDTTGGNSGSPTLNARGELVGLLFDGTYESINGDWDFTDSTRSIHVDGRYMLWVMEKLDGAENLLEEMEIVGLEQE
ncbi:S46 family peptidase [Gallaecimonas sp. GXIMD4217]|uniref:S46 family peptidase n=1 Tax=Gallaecimonas sp. GXIMD4217 TaxID=3131927 RepID=UPI00311B074E